MSTVERPGSLLESESRKFDQTRFVPDHLVEAFLIVDPTQVQSLKAEREASGLDRRDEVWDGIYVMSPAANLEHQFFGQELWYVFRQLLPEIGGGIAYNVLNVSDRVEGWLENFREPDVGVYLPGNPAIFCKAHICGGPDFAVEILSDNDMARKKLDFYARVNTRELLILDRDPWALELYRLVNGKLELVGISTPEKPETLTSGVLPLTLRLVVGENRPTIELGRLDGGQTWRI